MSEKIQPGDLVMVVKPTPCCGADKRVGQIGRVVSVGYEKFRCVHCLRRRFEFGAKFEGGVAQPVERLKRIPPLDGGDVVVKEKELTA